MRLKVVITVFCRIARTRSAWYFTCFYYYLHVLLHRCPRCNHIVVTIHHLIGLGAFCHSIKQVAPRVIKQEHTKGVYNRIVVTIATDFTFFFFFFFHFSCIPVFISAAVGAQKPQPRENLLIVAIWILASWSPRMNCCKISRNAFDVCVDKRYDDIFCEKI